MTMEYFQWWSLSCHEGYYSAETNPGMELVTQQTFCFSPKIQAGDNKRAMMTLSLVVVVVVVVVVVDRFDIALFSALEQTHCACM